MWMDRYAVAHVDEIGELDDGRAPMRAVRHHFGITSFGVNAWIAHEAGARIINEHDEAEPDSNEELYLVLCGRASFEVDGEQFDAPAGTFVFVRPGVKRTAFGEEQARRSSPWAVFPESRTSLAAGSFLRPCGHSTRRAITVRRRIEDASGWRAIRRTPTCSTTSPAAKASPARRTGPSRTFGVRSNSRSGPARSLRAIPTSIRSARTPRSRNCSRGDFSSATRSAVLQTECRHDARPRRGCRSWHLEHRDAVHSALPPFPDVHLRVRVPAPPVCAASEGHRQLAALKAVSCARGETQGREVVTGQTCFLANAVVRSVMAKTTEFRPQQACHGPGLGRSHTAESGPRGVVHATLSRAGVQPSETVVVERKQVVTAGLVRRSRLVQQGVPRRLPRGWCLRGRRRSPVPVCTAALSDQEALWLQVRPLRHSIFAGPTKSGCWETPGAGSTLPCAGV